MLHVEKWCLLENRPNNWSKAANEIHLLNMCSQGVSLLAKIEVCSAHKFFAKIKYGCVLQENFLKNFTCFSLFRLPGKILKCSARRFLKIFDHFPPFLASWQILMCSAQTFLNILTLLCSWELIKFELPGRWRTVILQNF